jgi:hypothetical protein
MSVEYFKYFGTRKDFFENEIINKKGAYRHKLIQKKLLRFSDEEIEDYLDYRFVENGCLFLRSDDNKIWVFIVRVEVKMTSKVKTRVKILSNSIYLM